MAAVISLFFTRAIWSFCTAYFSEEFKTLREKSDGLALLHVFAYKYMYMVLLELSAKTACQVLRSSNSRLYWRFSYKNKYIQQLFVTLKLYYFEHAWYK